MWLALKYSVSPSVALFFFVSFPESERKKERGEKKVRLKKPW